MGLLERFRLDGKVAVVTGGSRGIGRAIALGLADAGAQVVVASRSVERCVEVAGEAARLGGAGLAVPCDVTDEADVASLFARVGDELGGADVLVHCAGVSTAAPASEVRRSDLQAMMDIHYLAAVGAAQRAATQMREKGGGSMLMVSSVWGLGGASRMLAYGAAKAALTHTVKVLGLEWARDGIRVNGLAPGFVETEMTDTLPEGAREKLIARVPLRRGAQPDEMAAAALFLLSEAGSYVNGHVLVADGGERAR